MKRLLLWLSRRSVVIITILLIAAGVIFAWYLSVGFSPDINRVAIGIAAITAYLAAISALANLLQSVEVQKQRQAQERPYITAYFDGSSSGAIFFVIENVGNSPAIDVRIRFSPPPTDFAGRSLDKVSLFANPISFLPAMKVLRQVLDAGYRFLEEGKPTKFSVTVQYSSVYGDSFKETVEHDLEYMKQATIPGKSSEDHLKSIADNLKSIDGVFKSVRGLNSLIIESPKEYRSRIDNIARNDQEIPSWKQILLSICYWLISRLE